MHFCGSQMNVAVASDAAHGPAASTPLLAQERLYRRPFNDLENRRVPSTTDDWALQQRQGAPGLPHHQVVPISGGLQMSGNFVRAVVLTFV